MFAQLLSLLLISMSWLCFLCDLSEEDEIPSQSGISAIYATKKSNKVGDEISIKEKISHHNIIKMLLLGGPESGKSTIFKQMR